MNQNRLQNYMLRLLQQHKIPAEYSRVELLEHITPIC